MQEHPPDSAQARTTPAEGLFDTAQWDEWLARLRAVQEAVARVPPLPAVLWAGGIVLLGTAAGVRIVRFQRLIRGATPAPDHVRGMVVAASESFGLRRAPRTVMVKDRVSPMIWCGRSALLVLPTALWEELDETGRCAVVHHELAHLRRRDHWVCWAELVVAAVYWWHPVVWWARRRLREEADACCDAWVVSLMPRDRRGYAQALLETRRYLSESRLTPPAVGLGVTSAGAKRFARRLTMVMTARQTPRLSFAGIALSASIAAAGAFSAPLWACPPESKGDKAETKVVLEKSLKHGKEKHKDHKKDKHGHAHAAPRAQGGETPTPDAASTFERHMAEREMAERDRARAERTPRPPRGDNSDDGDIDRRLDRLEERLDRLTERLDRLLSRGDGEGRPQQLITSEGLADGAGGGVVVRSYALPGAKREALLALLVRPDVPIRVATLEDAIEVHATEAEQAIVNAFVTMINPEERVKAYHLPCEKLDALTKLMIRSDVPIKVKPGEGEITVHGDDLDQCVFQSFLGLIEPTVLEPHASAALLRLAQPGVCAAGAVELTNALAALRTSVEAEGTAVLADAAQLLEDGVKSVEEQARQFEEQAAEFERQAAEFEHRTAELAAQVAEFESRSESLENEAERLREEAESLEDEAAKAEANARAEALDGEARTEASTAGGFEAELEAMEAQAEAMYEQAEAAREQAEAMREQADTMREEAEAALATR